MMQPVRLRSYYSRWVTLLGGAIVEGSIYFSSSAIQIEVAALLL
ncbi:hypothetical protein AB0758_45430 [Tolypothrix bouteillei VB521301_2]